MLMRVEKVVPPDESELPALTSFISSVLIADLRKTDWKEFVDSLVDRFGSTRDDSHIQALVASTSNILDSTFLAGTNEEVATLGETDKLTDRQLRLETARIAMNAANASVDSLVTSALEQWLRNKALLRSGEEVGLQDDSEVLRTLDKTRDSALVEI